MLRKCVAPLRNAVRDPVLCILRKSASLVIGGFSSGSNRVRCCSTSRAAVIALVKVQIIPIRPSRASRLRRLRFTCPSRGNTDRFSGSSVSIMGSAETVYNEIHYSRNSRGEALNHPSSFWTTVTRPSDPPLNPSPSVGDITERLSSSSKEQKEDER